ncbi:leucine-rich repeat protein 1 isoform X1 [Neodiprion lecontei]|uniref:Leucine-rich repeat protein 1 isoform X1 n=2 Tax=Neodiprion lecontei TaxID=441921 RepID=A0A6J0B6F4_NEOLC|nr:leucine-rich repeat protein 1 isoform X1 [Neodiprion lecontei]
MRLICTVKVDASRMCPGAIRTGIQRPRASTLSFGRRPNHKDEICLLLQSAQDTKGMRYNVVGNIVHIFTKFINEGKCTIRLKEPAHDLIIQADALLLKSFLRVIKLAFVKNSFEPVLKVPVLNEKYFRPKIQTKCFVTTNAEYPTLQGFPRTTQHLSIVDLQKKSFDRQILRLNQLRSLDLSKNCIRSLPVELGSLPNLAELCLAENQLGKSPPKSWAWLNGHAMKKNLITLDLGRNELRWIPPYIGKLIALRTLSLNHNLLSSLPFNIGFLSSLRFFSLQENLLDMLPGSVQRLHLETIDVSGNTFNPQGFEGCKIDPYKLDVPDLVEIAAKAVLRSRLRYGPETIPRGLVKYLDEALYCECGEACFNYHLRSIIMFDLRAIAEKCVLSMDPRIPLRCIFCSERCRYRRH